jgi:hypothetical protein
MTERQNVTEFAARSADISFMLFALGAVIGLFRMFTTTVPFGKGFEMVALAEHLARSGAYANPFLVLDTGPTAANPPMYPLLLAVLFKAFGPNFVPPAATLGVVFSNAATAALLPRVSHLFYRDLRPGIFAAVLWLLSMPLMPSWDASYTVVSLLAFCLLSSIFISKQDFILYGLVPGLLAGALFLFNPSTMLIFIPWLIYLAYNRENSRGHAAGFCLLVCGVVATAAFGWMLRNHQQLGGFRVRTNLGMTLYASNNDCAQASLLDEEKTNCYQARHPNTSIEEARLLRSLGEIEYDRLRIRDAKTWIRTNPAVFTWLSLARMRDFWFPERGEHPFESIVIWISTLLSIPGMVLMVLRRERATLFVLFVLLIYPLMYYIVVSDLRYRAPVLWLSLLPAGYFVFIISDRITKATVK